MKKSFIFIVVILLILAGVYLSKNQIKSRIGISANPSEAPVALRVKPKATPMPPPNDVYLLRTPSTKDTYVTNPQGKTLYTFDKDTVGVSNCTGACAVKWPAYIPGVTVDKDLPTNISIITKTDGTKQYAWKGLPLYTYSGDSKLGDQHGDNFGKVWHIVRP